MEGGVSRHFTRYSDVVLLWRANPGAARAYVLAVCCVIVQSVIMVFSAPSRTQGPAWSTINDFGGPDVYGIALMVVALAMILSALHGTQAARVSLLTASIAEFLLAASYFRSTMITDQASFMGAAVVFTLALWMISNSELYRTARR